MLLGEQGKPHGYSIKETIIREVGYKGEKAGNSYNSQGVKDNLKSKCHSVIERIGFNE